MILDLCECILNEMITPNINQILHNIQKADVCTATQCFETNEDAGFGKISENPVSNYMNKRFESKHKLVDPEHLAITNWSPRPHR